jgi:hypothetical protein
VVEDDDTAADRAGQVAEWLVWAALTLSSPLHVFLPLRDMGIDGIVRLPGTDIAAAVQVKSRHVLRDGKIHLLVRDAELRDPHAVVVAVVLHAAERVLHDVAICVDVLTFIDLAFRRDGIDHGYQASIPFPPDAASRWSPFAVRIDDLAQRVVPALAEAAATVHSPPPPSRPPGVGSDVGYRAEARLLALLAEHECLNVFKAFPDMEMVEYCVRHVLTGGIAGIQVKAISIDAAHPRGTVQVPPHTFRPTPNTWFTVFAERRNHQSLHPTCLLIPSMDMGEVLIDHDGERSFTWDPDSTRHDASVAPYRVPTTELAARLASVLELTPQRTA